MPKNLKDAQCEIIHKRYPVEDCIICRYEEAVKRYLVKFRLYDTLLELAGIDVDIEVNKING